MSVKPWQAQTEASRSFVRTMMHRASQTASGQRHAEAFAAALDLLYAATQGRIVDEPDEAVHDYDCARHADLPCSCGYSS